MLLPKPNWFLAMKLDEETTYPFPIDLCLTLCIQPRCGFILAVCLRLELAGRLFESCMFYICLFHWLKQFDVSTLNMADKLVNFLHFWVYHC